jgi:2-keto-4-pentenoate hydratase
LKKDDVHNTGNATDIVWVKAGDVACVDFSGLGSVRLTIE